MAGASFVTSLTLVIPALDEEMALPRLARSIAALYPQPDEIILVDGGSKDRTRELATDFGYRVITTEKPGRARQINRGVEEASSELVCVLHADTILPDDAVEVIKAAMQDPKTALAGFTAVLTGPQRTRWFTSFHNWAKTWYAPALFRPHLFFRGCRLLFGDHAMFFRRQDYLDIGGCDPEMMVWKRLTFASR